MKNIVLTTLLALTLTACGGEAEKTETDPIKIGWLYSYTALPHWLKHARNAAEMAVDEVNSAGGINGRQVELIVRDDRANPSDGIQVATELVERDNVDVLAGTSFGAVSKAVYEYAQRHKVPYFATWCSSDMCVKRDPPYVISFEPPYAQQGRNLAAVAAKFPERKWAVVRNADNWGASMSKNFVKALKKLNPETEIVTDIIIPYGEVNGVEVIQALRAKGAEAVVLTIAGADLVKYVRAHKKLGTSDDFKHAHMDLPPEELRYLGAEIPSGWAVIGYPEVLLETPAHTAFLEAYHARTGTYPGKVGLITYAATKFMLAALEKAGSTKPEDVIKAAYQLKVQTPTGELHIDPGTNISNFTYWYGILEQQNGEPVLTNYKRGDEF